MARLFLLFLVLYLSDHVLTTVGLSQGGSELNPVAARFYEAGPDVALAAKAAGVGVVVVGIVLAPRLMRPLLWVWASLFAVVDLWSVAQIMLSLSG